MNAAFPPACILALGTSTDWCSVALLRRHAGQVMTDSISHEQPQGHAQRLLPMIRELLDELRVGLADLDAIAFDAGPGTFTGLRIGCGVAQGLGFALDKPLIAVGSLAAIAWQARSYRYAMIAVDARMGEVYCATFVRDETDRMIEQAAPVVLSAAGAIDFFESQSHTTGRASAHGANICLLGNGFERYPALARWAGGFAAPLRSAAWPSADAIATLGEAALHAGEAISAGLAAPLYVRDKVALDNVEQSTLRALRRP